MHERAQRRSLAARGLISSALALWLSAGAGADSLGSLQPEQPAAPAADSAPTPQAEDLGEPAPPLDIKGLQALIISVEGKYARWRPSAEHEWQEAKVNDLLDPGVEVDVGVRSQMGLRIGKNATLVVDRMTRLYLPEIAQEADTLRTRVAVVRGKAEFKVDHVGLTNDFQVSTPTTTLAVAGTEGVIGYGAFNGTEVEGAASNVANAINLRYFGRQQASLSGGGRSSDARPSQVANALTETVGAPPSLGTTDAGAGDQYAELGFVPDQTATNTQAVNNATSTQMTIQTFVTGGGAGTPEGGGNVPNPAPNPPGGAQPGGSAPSGGSAAPGGSAPPPRGPGGGFTMPPGGHVFPGNGGADRPIPAPTLPGPTGGLGGDAAGALGGGAAGRAYLAERGFLRPGVASPGR